MKNHILLLLLLLVSLNSCSSDDDNGTNSNIQINPPSWIQGTWFLEGTDSGFRFTSNDFIIITFSNMQSSQREQLEFFSGTDAEASATDNASDDSYSIILNFPAGQTFNYTFDRISDNEIQTTTSGVTAIYVKQ